MKPKAIRSILALVLLVGLLLAVAPVSVRQTTIVYDTIPSPTAAEHGEPVGFQATTDF